MNNQATTYNLNNLNNPNNMAQWRGQVWNALRTDNVTMFSSLFPDEQRVRDASYDIWAPREPPTNRPLLDVVASIRPHIHDGQPALRCLRWLMETYPNVYDVADIQWVITRNEHAMENDVNVQEGYQAINQCLSEFTP